MKKILAFFLALSSLNCGPLQRHEKKDTVSSTEQLTVQYNVYHSLAPRGWDISEGCDALLFVSLQQVGLGEMGPVEDARDASGRWHRLPGPEYAARCSSDISRDMYIGLFVWIWHNKRLDLAEDIWSYGTSHSWKMGEERTSFDTRTIFTPATISLLADLIKALGGEDHAERKIPMVYNTSEGFVSHLTLLQIHLRGEMHSGLTENELDTLKAIRKHMSQNPLVHFLIHRYTDGDQSEATRLLLEIWPSDRLPTAADWAEAWRLQRSDGDPGLNPGSGTEEHPGGDFLFVAALILGRLD